MQQFYLLICAQLDKSSEQLEKFNKFTYITEKTKYNLFWS